MPRITTSSLLWRKAFIFVSTIVIYGIRFSFSIFYPYILNKFGWSRADTAGIFSLNIFTYGLMAPISGKLADKVNPRRIIPIGVF